ncbi:hypothetical protein D3C80_1669070 [compost metagenome]
MNVQRIVAGFAERHGQFDLVAFLLHALACLSTCSAQNPNHFCGRALQGPTAGHATIPTPVVIDPKAANASVHVVLRSQHCPWRAQLPIEIERRKGQQHRQQAEDEFAATPEALALIKVHG